MREIKFRAWDSLANRMINNDCVDLFIHFDGELNSMDDNCNVIGTNRTSRLKLILMQYTGLKDKNGTEMYEGSIIEFRTFDGLKYIGDIEYNDSELLYEVNTTDGTAPCLYLLCDVIDFETIEVIGNIHENKNLLK